MRVLIIGAHGAIGKIITAEFIKKHEVVTAGRTSGDFRVDISSAGSIENLFQSAGRLDACILAAGDSETRDLSELTTEDLEIGIKNKLLGAINLVLVGQKYLNDRGSFTLTSGKMGDKPIKGSSGKAFVNGALNSFVMAAALDLERGLRLNAVSPARIGKVSSEDVVAAYVKSVESEANGEVFRVY